MDIKSIAAAEVQRIRAEAERLRREIPKAPLNTDAVVLDFKKKIPVESLERHINDYKKGRARNSKDVGQKLNAIESENTQLLGGSNPQALVQFSSYASMMRYGQKARFISGVNDSLRSIQRIEGLKA